MSLKIVHVVAGLWKDTGGPAEVIPNLCRAQAEAGAEVTLCTLSGDLAPQVEALKSSPVNLQVFDFHNRTIRFSPELNRYLRDMVGVDVIHNHGHWLYPNWCAAHWARRRRCAFVTTPHGTLVPGMLSRARIKKAISWNVFDRRIIKTADRIHALSEAEKEMMTPKLGIFSARAVVIPNGVFLPIVHSIHRSAKKKQLLFLSRLAPIKGVCELFEAWLEIETKVPDWTLKLVGPVDHSVQKALDDFLVKSRSATFVGPAYGDDRWQHYCDADAFILPTFGEGLPTVLLEAAAHGVPVLTTAEANFPELISSGGGVLTEPKTVSLKSSLLSFLGMPSESLLTIGANGRRLIEKKYGWPKVAESWLKTYKEILDCDEK